MTETPPLIDAVGLSKRYGSPPLWALRDATFSVHEGEVLGLIGPNGSGKTTLFECLAGVAPASAGMVRSRGTIVDTNGRKRVLFYVPDHVRPWPDQPVHWVLRFMRGLYDMAAASRDDVLESLGLEQLLGAQLRELSKGEHKRVLLAMGLLTPHPLLLLDEPFDGLDLRQTRDAMRVLRKHTATGRTLFLSIHQLGDAARICDRLILLSNGRVVGEGTMDHLRAKAGITGRAGPIGLEEVFLALT